MLLERRLQMDCKTCQDQLGLYIEDELNLEEKKKVKEHIESCEVCQKEFDMLQYTLKQLTHLPEKELPKNFHSQLKEQLKKENSSSQKQKRLGFSFWKPLTAGVLAAGIIGLLWINDFGFMGGMDRSQSVKERQSDDQIMMEKAEENTSNVEGNNKLLNHDMRAEPEANLKIAEFDQTEETQAANEEARILQDPILLKKIVDQVMRLDEGLNADIRFISIDNQIAEMSLEPFTQDLQDYVEDQYGVELRFQEMEDLKKAGLWDEESKSLQGVLLQFQEIQIIDVQHLKLIGSKFRSSLGAVGFEIDGKKEDTTWDLESRMTWIS